MVYQSQERRIICMGTMTHLFFLAFDEAWVALQTGISARMAHGNCSIRWRRRTVDKIATTMVKKSHLSYPSSGRAWCAQFEPIPFAKCKKGVLLLLLRLRRTHSEIIL